MAVASRKYANLDLVTDLIFSISFRMVMRVLAGQFMSSTIIYTLWVAGGIGVLFLAARFVLHKFIPPSE